MSEGNPLPEKVAIAVDDSEILARAFYPPEWDENVRRSSPGCFKRNNTSVTRHREMTFSQLVSRLKGDVEKAESTVVVRAIGLICANQIKQIGLNYQKAVYFEIWERPTPRNPDHAEVAPYSDATLTSLNHEVSRGLSRQLSNALELFVVAPDGEVEDRIPPIS